MVIFSFLSLRKLNRFENHIPEIDDYITVHEDGTVEMDKRLMGILQAVGQTLFQSAKFSMMQGLSAQKKLDTGLKSAFAKDIVDNKMPALNLLGDVIGYNVKAYVAKNPDAFFQILQQPAVQQIIGQFISGQGQQSNGSGQRNWKLK